LVQIGHLRELVSNYVELRMARQEMIERVNDSIPPKDIDDWMEGGFTPPYRTVPVVSYTNKQEIIYAKVSNEDFFKVRSVSNIWRENFGGYATHSTKDPVDPKKAKTTYMHCLISGGRSSHINGDKMDNRRENLSPSSYNRKNKKQKLSPIEIDDFILKTPRLTTWTIQTYQHDDPLLPLINGYAVIKFGKKTYSGEVKHGEPAGYGMISQNINPYDMCGIWKDGKLMDGMITYYKPLPLTMDNDSRLVTPREVWRVEIVSNGHKTCSAEN
jgi:hypothetical protein